MDESIETRELISVAVPGSLLRGTYHRPPEKRSGSRARRDQQIGVLLMNSGFLPRSGLGDSSVYWADSFAERGYPSFRLDLQGLGDSDGHVPEDIVGFVNSGGYGPEICAIVKDIVRRFSLSGVVVIGHCAITISAVYAAAAIKECRGLVLLDPYFYLPKESAKVRAGLSHWATRSRLGGLFGKTYRSLRQVQMLLSRNRPPGNANFPLLSRWRRLGSGGLPILVLKAPDLKSRGIQPGLGEFDYLKYIQKSSGPGNQIVVKFVEGTNHSFADRLGRSSVRQLTGQWLHAHFPLIEHQGHVPNPLPSEPSGVESRTVNYELR